MPKINLLAKSVSELIAAGEVVERPASVIKETLENSIDAGAKRITVEIKHGGITFIRITDDGCGIESEDVPLAFLRHATSKIKNANDLTSIKTLGFRGEALAAISSVSRVEVLTKTQKSDIGTHYVIEGGTEKENTPAGCPNGTTLIVRDIFFNTPARMKFLKKDASEAVAVGAVAERVALSHPEIAFKFIRDEKTVFSTSGNGKLSDTVYSVLGRDFHKGLIELGEKENGIGVKGFVSKPVFCRPSRSHQFTFINGRLVISRTVMAAVEQAYKGMSMVGKFPGFVIFLEIPPETVDVNVHPAKTEVRFSDEKRIFSAVHFAVKNALSKGDERPNIEISQKKPTFFKMSAEEYRQTAVELPTQSQNNDTVLMFKQDSTPFFLREDVQKYKEERAKEAKQTETSFADTEPQKETSVGEDVKKTQEYAPESEVLFVGEAFSTYIIVQKGETLYFIDKHAAHERIIFNRLKTQSVAQSQSLLSPVALKLEEKYYSAIISGTELLYKAGFEIEDFGVGTVLIRAIPAALDKKDISETVLEAAESLVLSKTVSSGVLDDIYHSVACKAAIKAGYKTTKEELLSLAVKVLNDRDVMYCPHGRPVAYAIKKTELHKYFGRIQ